MKIHRVKEGKMIIINERKEKKKKKTGKTQEKWSFLCRRFQNNFDAKIGIKHTKKLRTRTHRMCTHTSAIRRCVLNETFQCSSISLSRSAKNGSVNSFFARRRMPHELQIIF